MFKCFQRHILNERFLYFCSINFLINDHFLNFQTLFDLVIVFDENDSFSKEDMHFS